MPNRNYQNGVAFERRVKKHLEDRGYLVIRSAGSHGAVDLVALSLGIGSTLLVQCKRTGKISRKDAENLVDLGHKYNAEPVVASMPGARGISIKSVFLVNGKVTYVEI